MSATVYFVVYGNPVGKGRPRATSRGGFVRMYTDAKTLGFESAVADEARIAMREWQAFDTPIQLQLSAYYPIPKSWSKKKRQMAMDGEIHPQVKPDLDNVMKAVLDAMNGVVYVDDSQVINMVATKRYSSDPRVEVYLHEVLK
jgi:Holliday junction resolvase RusA-like endonuclease